jgi:hypothetical protein
MSRISTVEYERRVAAWRATQHALATGSMGSRHEPFVPVFVPSEGSREPIEGPLRGLPHARAHYAGAGTRESPWVHGFMGSWVHGFAGRPCS